MRRVVAASSGILFLIVLALTPAPAGRAEPQSRITAHELLRELASRAEAQAERSRKSRRPVDAGIWLSWANHFRNVGRTVPPRYPAQQLLLLNAQYCRNVESFASRHGVQEYRALYGASARLWESIARQLRDDVSGLKFTFPAAMLRVIPGAPGTPWEHMGRTFGRNAPSGYTVTASPCGASGQRMCYQCKGTGVEDHTAFANPYSEGYDASKYRRTCPNCRGKGTVSCR